MVMAKLAKTVEARQDKTSSAQGLGAHHEYDDVVGDDGAALRWLDDGEQGQWRRLHGDSKVGAKLGHKKQGISI